jgi:polyhydroxybutyrate depolymerase
VRSGLGRGCLLSRAVAWLTLASAALLGACRPDPVDTTLIEPRTRRAYRVVTRSDHDPRVPAPVLFALHPYRTVPAVLVEGLSLIAHAVQDRGYVLVVPEGARDDEGQPFWNASAACCGKTARPPDDVAYLKAVLDDLGSRHALDRERVFAIGASNGGFMAQRWACDQRGDLRAIVSVSGAAQGPDDPPCAPGRPLRVLSIHGDRDPLILYEGGRSAGGRYPSARSTAESWRKSNRLEGDPERSTRWVFRLGSLKVEEWRGPARVALWTVEGGDHELRGVRRLVPELLDFLEGK